jgi:hypothetical protein
VWVRQEGQARDFTNGGFVGWAFWAESDCHWFKRANGLALTGARHSCARPG